MGKKTAVVLLQLGGPDSTDAVAPFLYNLFMDPDIIDFPLASIARRPLARFISSRRSKRVAENYRAIGGKSPILELTRRQADGLEAALTNAGIDARVYIAMRYWHPLTEEVVRQIRENGEERVLLLPLYPQFSKATTYSSVNEWHRQCERLGLRDLPTQLVCCYPEEAGLVEAIVDRINEALARFGTTDPSEIDLVFSAHGVPVQFIEAGDPYQLQINLTVRRVLERGKWTSPHHQCYQSKVGPAKWLTPSLVGTVERLAHAGRKNLLVIPVAFLTDHIETLHEINMEVRHEALRQGVRQFETMPAVNDHPSFIAGLASLVRRHLDGPLRHSTCFDARSANGGIHEPRLCPWYAEIKKEHGTGKN